LVAACALFGGSCGDDGSASQGEESGASGAMGTAPSFTEVNERVFVSGCVFKACHGAKGPQAGLDLETDPYAAIVDIVAQNANTKLVAAGDPNASYLYEKIARAMPAVGERMPPKSPLSDERIELVRAWIAAGAKKD
jgi:hypothetical protein